MKMSLLLTLLLLNACSGSSKGRSPEKKTVTEAADVTVTSEWDHTPTANTSDNTVTLTFDTGDRKIEIVDFDPHMPTHGHGTVKTHQKIEALNEESTQVKVTGVYFVMPGPWVIDVFFLIDGEEKKVSFNVEVQ